MQIAEILKKHVTLTGMFHQSDFSTGRYAGKLKQLNRHLAKAPPDPNYLNGWSYLITCCDGSAYLTYDAGKQCFILAEKPPALLRAYKLRRIHQTLH